MDASSKYQVPRASRDLTPSVARRCHWRQGCILARGTMDKDPAGDCAARLPKATCTWLCKEEGYTAVSLVVSFGETPVKKVGEWFGFGEDTAKLARLREKFNVLVDYGVFASRRGPSKQGEKLYHVQDLAHPLVQQCITKYKARRDAKKVEAVAAWQRAEELAQEHEKMKRLRLP